MFEKLMMKSDECILKAIEYSKKGDENLSKFYLSAGKGFKKRAMMLTLEEVI